MDATPDTQIPEPTPVGRGRVASGDGGFAMVYFALVLVVFMSMAGLGLDLWSMWRNAQEVQRAADAGALAGVTFLPGDVNGARNTAFDAVEANGYDQADATAEQADTPQKLRVTVSTTVRTPFMGLLGRSSTRITRAAVAEFVGPVPMGSPTNNLGNDPELNLITDHWMNVASVRNQAGNGDRYQAGLCTGSVLGPCQAGAITNPSYAPNGHFYAVEVTGGGGPLRIEIFDPAFYEVGDVCTSGRAAVFNTNAAALQSTAAGDVDIPDTWHDDAAARYVGGNSQTWCTGDHRAGAATGGNGPITTTYTVRAPDNTPFIDTDNPVVSTSDCSPRQFTGRDNAWMQAGGGLQGRLSSGAESKVTNVGGFQQTVANSFRRWVTVCEITAPTPGRYLLQVRTNAPLGQPLVIAPQTVNTWGHNRYAIRAGIGDAGDATFGDNVKVFANGRLPIYANADGADTEFFLARVVPSGVDRILIVSLWDISDGGSSGSMQVLPPSSGAGETGGTFSGCTYSSSGGSYTPQDDCRFSFNAGNLNSQLMQVSVPIPSTYACNEADPFGCWIKVRAPFGGPVNDTTTWSADVAGDPVRLIE